MNLLEIIKIFLSLVIGIVPAMAFYSVIALVIIRSKEQANPPKPPEFHPDRHIYYPCRTVSFLKLMYMFLLGAALCLVFPFAVTMISYRLLKGGAVLVALAVFAGGIIVTIRLVKESSGNTADYMIVTSDALIVHYKSGRLEQHACRNHSGYRKGERGVVYIVFHDQNGTETTISLEGLSENDVLLLQNDLGKIRKSGNLSGKGPQMQSGSTFAQNMQQTGSASAQNAQQTGPTTAQNAQQAKPAQSKREQYYADPANYERHLKRVADKIIPQKKNEIVKLVEKGERLRAATQVRNQTDCSLQEARDIIFSYQKYLLGKEGENTGTGIAGAPQEAAVRTQQEKNALYADPETYTAYLKKEAGKLSAERRREIVKTIESGYVMPAIKQCREWTGLGLREARDMVDAWKICFADENSIPPAAEAQPQVQPQVQPMVSGEPRVEVQPVSAVMPEVQPVPMTMPEVQPVPAVMPEVQPAPAVMPETEAKKELSWTLRITDKEQSVVDKRSLERNIDQAIVDIGRKREEFLVLAPSEPVRGICFMQVCQDTNNIYFHVEAGFNEKNEQGNPKLFGRDRLMSWEARNICMAFYQGEEIPMTDWSEVKK